MSFRSICSYFVVCACVYVCMRGCAYIYALESVRTESAKVESKYEKQKNEVKSAEQQQKYSGARSQVSLHGDYTGTVQGQTNTVERSHVSEKEEGFSASDFNKLNQHGMFLVNVFINVGFILIIINTIEGSGQNGAERARGKLRKTELIAILYVEDTQSNNNMITVTI